MNTYKTSTGERLKKSVIDSLVKKAKAQKLKEQFEEHGYNFCEQCKISCGVRLTCAHLESVNDCQRNGTSEKAFDVSNISIMCMGCHSKYDLNNVRFNENKKR